MSEVDNRHKFWLRRWKCRSCKRKQRYPFNSRFGRADLKEELFEKARNDHRIAVSDAYDDCINPELVIEIRDLYIQTEIKEEKGKHGTTGS